MYTREAYTSSRHFLSKERMSTFGERWNQLISTMHFAQCATFAEARAIAHGMYGTTIGVCDIVSPFPSPVYPDVYLELRGVYG
jgi:hypothetical protein